MDKVKVGILGLRRGLSHLRNFLNTDEAEVIGAADRIAACRDRAAETVERMGRKVEFVAEFEELLTLKPDAVAIASNGRLQAGHAIQAMEAGCHVLSEVPGAMTQEEILRLAVTVERTGKQYMLAENSSFQNFLRYWRKWVMAGRFGAISMADGEYLHYLPATMVNEAGERFTPTQVREQGIQDVRPTWRADQPPIQYLTHDLGAAPGGAGRPRGVCKLCGGALVERGYAAAVGRAVRPVQNGQGALDPHPGDAEHPAPGRAQLPPFWDRGEYRVVFPRRVLPQAGPGPRRESGLGEGGYRDGAFRGGQGVRPRGNRYLDGRHVQPGAGGWQACADRCVSYGGLYAARYSGQSLGGERGDGRCRAGHPP